MKGRYEPRRPVLERDFIKGETFVEASAGGGTRAVYPVLPAMTQYRPRDTETGKNKIPKHQAPNFKQAPSTKSQYSNRDKSLSEVSCFEFGAWNLEFVCDLVLEI